jgi:hypothetical protein
MSDERGFTADEVVGLLPGGWTLADATQPGEWEPTGQRWRIRLVDGAAVRREVVVGARIIARHGRLEALRHELDRVYRRALS